MTLKTFAGRMFKHCPLLSQWAHDSETAYQTFLDYKFKVPVCGAIILNPALNKVLLVKGWNSRASWGFPRGKINKDEPEWQCAQREVIEETGFDILPYLVEKHRIEITQMDQKVVLYIITGISESTEFVPTTRKEISQVQWHRIEDLPCGGKSDRIQSNNYQASKSPADKEHRYYLIKPFIRKIKTWVSRHPEKIGMPAVVVNPDGRPPVQAPRANNTDFDGSRSGSTVPFENGSNVMSVQDLFKAIGKQRALDDSDGGGADSLPRTAFTANSNAPSAGSALLLQTLVGSGQKDKAAAPSSNIVRQPGLTSTLAQNNKGAVNGQSVLDSFSFDTQRIMTAYRATHGV
ncbi:mRNA-decapping enzyme subunit 2 [Coemansia sp. Benny D160-2]|nr:mRNA-decapping enzyme subunit 2 [Coemansia sp. Benny D160-2]